MGAASFQMAIWLIGRFVYRLNPGEIVVTRRCFHMMPLRDR